MERKISQKFCSYLSENHLINPELIDVYIYGMELLLSSLLGSGIVLLVGALMHRLQQSICFLIIFVLLRRFTGGYHATTYIKCKITTVIVYMLTTVLAEVITVTEIGYLIFGLIGISIILLLGPIENPNKSIDKHERKKHKIISLTLFILLILSGIYFIIINNPLSNEIYFTLLSVVTLMIIPKILKGGAH